jgi:hypothetical protein
MVQRSSSPHSRHKSAQQKKLKRSSKSTAKKSPQVQEQSQEKTEHSKKKNKTKSDSTPKVTKAKLGLTTLIGDKNRIIDDSMNTIEVDIIFFEEDYNGFFASNEKTEGVKVFTPKDLNPGLFQTSIHIAMIEHRYFSR